MAQLNTEFEVKATEKLYEHRNNAKSLYNEKYNDEVKSYVELLKEVMSANNCNEINALILISRTKVYQESEVAQMMFMSAVVELIE